MFFAQSWYDRFQLETLRGFSSDCLDELSDDNSACIENMRQLWNFKQEMRDTLVGTFGLKPSSGPSLLDYVEDGESNKDILRGRKIGAWFTSCIPPKGKGFLMDDFTWSQTLGGQYPLKTIVSNWVKNRNSATSITIDESSKDLVALGDPDEGDEEFISQIDDTLQNSICIAGQ